MKRIIFLVFAVLLFLSCTQGKKNNMAMDNNKLPSIVDSEVAIQWDKIDDFKIDELNTQYLNKSIQRNFAENYAGPHGGMILFDSSNNIEGFVDFFYSDKHFLIILSEKVDEQNNRILDIRYVDRTYDNKLLSVSGKYKGKYLSHIIVITSADINSDTISSAENVFVFDLENKKIDDINYQDIQIFNEAG